MSTGDRIPLAEALSNAVAFREMFSGCFERWEIAGSIRRGKTEIGDVEHVVIPKFGPDPTAMRMFQEDVNLLWSRADSLFGEGRIKKAQYGVTGSVRWGERYRGCLYTGMKHELFVADALNFGAILAIRTGPAEFSERLVTQLRAREEYRQQGGYVVRVVPEEREYLELCGEPWTEPGDRR